MNYEAKWSSLDKRPVPEWFGKAKLGIFIHWGIYSVPAFAPKRKDVESTGEAYSEWYGYQYLDKKKAYWDFHKKTYGEDFKYEDFAPMFKAELFDAEKWAELIANSGAKYVTLTSKHHDGFCLWPSEYAWNWNSVDIGPHRDICGELREALLKRDIKPGLYYSIYEWFRPVYLKDPEQYAIEHMIPQMKELITKYKPPILFTDGEWDHPSKTWHSEEFLEWLFNESIVKDEIVVNDRWGSDTRSAHGGYFSTEYGEVGFDKEFNTEEKRSWEECRGIGASFGFNRNEDLIDYMSEKELIHLFVDTVSRGGNLNINIGPAADGTIPVIMQERLLQLGQWLKVNGEAIYDTVEYKVSSEKDVRFTSKDGCVYAFINEFPYGEIALDSIKYTENIKSVLLGTDIEIGVDRTDYGIKIVFPIINPDKLPCRSTYVIKISNSGKQF